MAFTQESDCTADLQPAIVGKGKRYAISLTTGCLLDFRDVFMKKALGLTPATSESLLDSVVKSEAVFVSQSATISSTRRVLLPDQDTIKAQAV